MFLLLAAGLAIAARIPSSTEIQIRLTKEMNTTTAKVGDVFEAIIIAPVVVDGHISMAAGVTVTGHLKEVTAAVNPDDQAVLALAGPLGFPLDFARGFGKTGRLARRPFPHEIRQLSLGDLG